MLKGLTENGELAHQQDTICGHAKSTLCALGSWSPIQGILPGTEIVKQRRSAADRGPHHHTKCMPPSSATIPDIQQPTCRSCYLTLQAYPTQQSPSERILLLYGCAAQQERAPLAVGYVREYAWAPGVNKTHMLCLSWLAALRRSNHLSACPSCAPNGSSAAG